MHKPTLSCRRMCVCVLSSHFPCRALYEVMFRAEPGKHVSRSSFLTAMRRVYGFQIAPLAGHVDRPALQTLGEVNRRYMLAVLPGIRPWPDSSNGRGLTRGSSIPHPKHDFEGIRSRNRTNRSKRQSRNTYCWEACQTNR